MGWPPTEVPVCWLSLSLPSPCPPTLHKGTSTYGCSEDIPCRSTHLAMTRSLSPLQHQVCECCFAQWQLCPVPSSEQAGDALISSPWKPSGNCTLLSTDPEDRPHGRALPIHSVHCPNRQGRAGEWQGTEPEFCSGKGARTPLQQSRTCLLLHISFFCCIDPCGPVEQT